jgi:hypothetical protein
MLEGDFTAAGVPEVVMGDVLGKIGDDGINSSPIIAGSADRS